MNKVKITLHGILAEQADRNEWNLKVKNVSEAIRGIQSQWKEFYSSLIKNDKKHIKYRVLINGDDFMIEEGKDPNTKAGLRSSELCLEKISSLKSIDIVPVIEGSKDFFDWFTVILAVALIWVGGAAIMAGAAWGSMYGMAVVAGIGLLAAGVANLLAEDPEFDDFREVEGGGRPSYVFSGPQNVVKEGGPVFIAYGRLLVGSQVIQAATDYFDELAGVPKNDHWGSSDYGLYYNIKGIGKSIDSRVDQYEKEITGV